MVFSSAAVRFGRWSLVNTAIPKILWISSALQQGYQGRSLFICDIHFTLVPLLLGIIWRQAPNDSFTCSSGFPLIPVYWRKKLRQSRQHQQKKSMKPGQELSHLSALCAWGTDWNRAEQKRYELKKIKASAESLLQVHLGYSLAVIARH